jgi:CRISPR/Cas system-associated exonuclease Cas4 (RecB family)
MHQLEQAFYSALRDRPPHVSQHQEPHCYASEALACRRQVWYRLRSAAPDTPHSPTTLINFAVGTLLHERMQAAIKAVYRDAETEVRWSLGHVTGRADARYTDEGGRATVAEIKTVNAGAWKRAVNGGTPHPAHIAQCNLSAYALGAVQLHLIYIRKETANKEVDPYAEWVQPASFDVARRDIDGFNRVAYALQAETRDVAVMVDEGAKAIGQWSMDAAPSAAAMESREMVTVVEAARNGTKVRRSYMGEVIDSPDTRPFPCGWCQYRAQCTVDGP